jgi:hypothetical protein
MAGSNSLPALKYSKRNSNKTDVTKASDPRARDLSYKSRLCTNKWRLCTKSLIDPLGNLTYNPPHESQKGESAMKVKTHLKAGEDGTYTAQAGGG